MPAHDWTRVGAGIFHHFHQDWVPGIARALNAGLMPQGYYALAEQAAEGPRPDVIALAATQPADSTADLREIDDRAVAVLEHPPKVRFTAEQERDIYAQSADRVAIRHASSDRIVAFIEIVSSGNTHTPHALQKFLEKLDEAWEQGIHLLVVDLHPPGKHDPRGVHAAFWELRSDASHGVTAEEPLGLAAYRMDEVPRCYFERVAIGQPLPDMPAFLTPLHYVNVPLEQTYTDSYNAMPERWKQVIEGSG